MLFGLVDRKHATYVRNELPCQLFLFKLINLYTTYLFKCVKLLFFSFIELFGS